MAIADDQALVLSGLRLLLEARGLTVTGEASDGRAAVTLVRDTRPDVILMDVRMPVLDGIAATREIARSGLPTRILILTTYDLDEYVYGALKAGASGFLLKATRPDRLAEGVRTVAAGDTLLAPAITRRLIERHLRPARLPDALTGREREVLLHIARGLTNPEIAATLHITEATVKTHVNRLLDKLGLRSRVQAVILAYECGLVRPGA
ncbi:response regulator transcription factor [Herbidospora sp. RD11066]